MTKISEGAVRQAVADAERVAAIAGVTVREMQGSDEEAQVTDLLSLIWGRTPENPVVPREFMRVLGKTGNYIGGAFVDGELVGASLGLHSSPERLTLHSHIAGVLPETVGRSEGYALKLHQRAWALARGIDVVEWTYDPLVSRNASFNIRKLGAQPLEYLENFYGAMADAINAGDLSDRLLVRWHLCDDAVVALAAGAQPLPAGVGSSTVAVPDDIESLRVTDPAEARAWRGRVREQLTSLMNDGSRIIGFERGTGYILQNTPTEGEEH